MTLCMMLCQPSLPTLLSPLSPTDLSHLFPPLSSVQGTSGALGVHEDRAALRHGCHLGVHQGPCHQDHHQVCEVHPRLLCQIDIYIHVHAYWKLCVHANMQQEWSEIALMCGGGWVHAHILDWYFVCT